MKIKNLTPHQVTLLGDSKLVIEPELTPARVSVTREIVTTIKINNSNINVNKSVFGQVENLPEPEEDTILIVSRVVFDALPERKDLAIVDDTVRDNNGRIIGARALIIRGLL